jgi:hypothetical protein
MPRYTIALEYKSGQLNRPMLQQIIGATVQTNPDADEIIVRCRNATRTAYEAARDIASQQTYKNSKGRLIRITIAVDAVTEEGRP